MDPREAAYQANLQVGSWLLQKRLGIKPKSVNVNKPVELRHIVTLQGGTKTPVVLISGIGGLGFLYARMAKDLQDHPVHVFNAIGIEADDKPVATVKEVAHIYLQQLIQVIPSGPVIVGGYSFGALVALELAIQLEAIGRKVPLLVSFDGFAPGYPRPLSLATRTVNQAKEIRRKLAEKNTAEKLSYLAYKATRVFAAKPAAGSDGLKFTPPGVDDPELDARLRAVATALWQARTSYRPWHRITSDVLLIKSHTKWDGMSNVPLYGWNGYINQNCTIHTDFVEGEHLKMFDSPQNERKIAELILAHV
jgi:thioesterase domain-containing protein